MKIQKFKKIRLLLIKICQKLLLNRDPIKGLEDMINIVNFIIVNIFQEKKVFKVKNFLI